MRKRSKQSSTKAGRQQPNKTSASFFSSSNVLALPELSKGIRGNYRINTGQDIFEHILTEINDFGIEWIRKESFELSLEATLQKWIDSIAGDKLDKFYSVCFCDHERLDCESDYISDNFNEYILFEVNEFFDYNVGKYLTYLAKQYGPEYGRYILDLADKMPVQHYTPNECYWHLEEMGTFGEYSEESPYGDSICLQNWHNQYPKWAWHQDYNCYDVKRWFHQYPRGLQQKVKQLEESLSEWKKVKDVRIHLDYTAPAFSLRWNDGDIISQVVDDLHNDYGQCGRIYASYLCVPVDSDGLKSIEVLFKCLVAGKELFSYCDENKRKRVKVAV
jgi:hypothetical protein